MATARWRAPVPGSAGVTLPCLMNSRPCWTPLRRRPTSARSMRSPSSVTRLDEFGGEHRNHDVVAVGLANAGRTLVAVEAKAREQFGPLLCKHYESGRAKKGSNIPERIRRLVRALFG